VLAREEEEFDNTFRLLCPSGFTAQTFVDRGYPREKILRHTYGFDETVYFPSKVPDQRQNRFTALFVGVDAVRKGLHLALEAWLSSAASKEGTFLVAGDLTAEYKKRFAKMLSEPSVTLLGHRNDVPELMRTADVLLMPSIEEGFGLVCVEAIGSGCVPLVSKACTDECRHMDNSLVHAVGDVQELRQHISLVHEDRSLLQKLRDTCIRERLNLTWKAAGQNLLNAYETAVSQYKSTPSEKMERCSPSTGRVLIPS
jgi:glycosyltransferase involved in cell wall biosynthesis